MKTFQLTKRLVFQPKLVEEPAPVGLDVRAGDGHSVWSPGGSSLLRTREHENVRPTAGREGNQSHRWQRAEPLVTLPNLQRHRVKIDLQPGSGIAAYGQYGSHGERAQRRGAAARANARQTGRQGREPASTVCNHSTRDANDGVALFGWSP